MISRVVKILKFTKGNQSGLTRGEGMGGFWDLGGTWEGPGGEFGTERKTGGSCHTLLSNVPMQHFTMYRFNSSLGLLFRGL